MCTCYFFFCQFLVIHVTPSHKKGLKSLGLIRATAKESEGQSLRPPLDSHTTTGHNFSLFWDTGLIQISNEPALCVLPDWANISKVITSTKDPFRENGSHIHQKTNVLTHNCLQNINDHVSVQQIDCCAGFGVWVRYRVWHPFNFDHDGIYMCLGKPICAPPRLSGVSPLLKQIRCWSDWGWPFLVLSRKIRWALPLSSLLQAVDGVVSLALCPQLVSQAPQHFRFS